MCVGETSGRGKEVMRVRWTRWTVDGKRKHVSMKMKIVQYRVGCSSFRGWCSRKEAAMVSVSVSCGQLTLLSIFVLPVSGGVLNIN